MITMTHVAETHGTRLRIEPVVPAAELSTYARVWKQRPFVPTLGGFRTDNSTGVSEVEYRHT